jgi:hypothetical protein
VRFRADVPGGGAQDAHQVRIADAGFTGGQAGPAAEPGDQTAGGPLNPKRAAYIIADNQLALNAGWDEELLRVELAALQAEDFNLGLIGFDDEDLARLLANEDSGLTDEDAAPDPPEDPVTRTGNLWLLGPHRVLCGDATSGEAVMRLCGAPGSRRQPFLMVTDPPYGIELDSEWRDRAGLNGCGPAESSYMKHRTEGHSETKISGDTRADWSEAFELLPNLQVAYVWHASKFTPVRTRRSGIRHRPSS